MAAAGASSCGFLYLLRPASLVHGMLMYTCYLPAGPTPRTFFQERVLVPKPWVGKGEGQGDDDGGDEVRRQAGRTHTLTD